MERIRNSTDLGKAIRSRRKSLNYTQQYISEVTGLSVSFLSDLENGKQTCETGKTLKLINILALDLNIEKRS